MNRSPQISSTRKMALSSVLIATCMLGAGCGGGDEEPGIWPATAMSQSTANPTDRAIAEIDAGIEMDGDVGTSYDVAPWIQDLTQEVMAQAAPDATAQSMTRQVRGRQIFRNLRDIAILDPAVPYARQTWNGTNCYGQYTGLRRLPDEGVTGPARPGQSPTRFGVEPDPNGSGQPVFVFRVYEQDPLTARGKRCEVAALPSGETALPKATTIWYAFRVMLDKGRLATPGRAVVTQWHQYGFNPFFSLMVSEGKLSFAIRHNANQPATRGNTSTVQIWADDRPVDNSWVTFVIQAKISPFEADGPFIRIWRNGENIVNRSGPIGYNAAGLQYTKLGYYHWMENNPWDPTYPERTVYFSKALLIEDESEIKTEEEVRLQVEAR